MKKNITLNMPKRIVILGSNSFIAKNLIKSLKKTNIKLILVNRKKCDFEKKSSIKILSELITAGDTIVFIAANAPVKNNEMFLSNLKMCNNIVLSLQNKKNIHLIYISSDAVYTDKKGLIAENSKTSPNSLHGLMHLTREKILSALKLKTYSILRPTLIYGLDDPHNGYGPNSFFRKASKNINIDLFGKGEERRDHIYIDDVTKIIKYVILQRKKGILNLVTGKVISFNNIAKKIIKITKSKSKIKFNPRIGLMPHNGYRAFKNKKLLNSFKDSLINLDRGIKLINESDKK